MNWFRRDNLDKKEVRKGKREEAVRPYQRAADSKPLLSSHSSLPSFSYSLLLFPALFALSAVEGFTGPKRSWWKGTADDLRRSGGFLSGDGRDGDGGGRCRALSGRKSKSPLIQSVPLSFLASMGLHKECGCKKHDSSNRQRNPQPYRHVNKEFTCQRHSKNCLRDIGKVAGCEFAPGVSNKIFHTANIYHIADRPSKVLCEMGRKP